MILLVSSQALIGKDVFDVRGSLIGGIVSLELNLDDWKVTHVNVELDVDVEDKLGLKTGFLGWDRHIMSVSVEFISSGGDVVKFKKEINDLKDLDKANVKVSAE